MSWEACTWASKQKLPALQKLVLIMLANHTNSESGQCNPSHSRLAERCGMSVTTCKKTIMELEQAGMLRIQHRSIDGVSLSNQYVLSLPPDQEATGGGSGDDQGVGRHATTKQESFKQEIETEEVTVKPKNPKASGGHVTLRTYVEANPEANWAPEDGKARKHLRSSGIPEEWVAYALRWFQDRYMDDEKKYKNWVATFANAVVGDWGRLWYFDQKSQTWALSSQGMAYKIKVDGGSQ